jgi:hypothetical protein
MAWTWVLELSPALLKVLALFVPTAAVAQMFAGDDHKTLPRFSVAHPLLDVGPQKPQQLQGSVVIHDAHFCSHCTIFSRISGSS